MAVVVAASAAVTVVVTAPSALSVHFGGISLAFTSIAMGNQTTTSHFPPSNFNDAPAVFFFIIRFLHVYNILHAEKILYIQF